MLPDCWWHMLRRFESPFFIECYKRQCSYERCPYISTRCMTGNTYPALIRNNGLRFSVDAYSSRTSCTFNWLWYSWNIVSFACEHCRARSRLSCHTFCPITCHTIIVAYLDISDALHCALWGVKWSNLIDNTESSSPILQDARTRSASLKTQPLSTTPCILTCPSTAISHNPQNSVHRIQQTAQNACMAYELCSASHRRWPQFTEDHNAAYAAAVFW